MKAPRDRRALEAAGRAANSLSKPSRRTLRRLLPAAASLLSVAILALALRASLRPDGFNDVLYDYAVWTSAALALYAAVADLRLHRRAALLGSTALLDLVGASLVLVGRAASALVNSLNLVPYFLPPPLGQFYTPLGLALSLWLFPGSLLILAATALHALRGAPLELAPGATVEELLAAASRWLERARSAAASLPWTAPLAAAAFALAFRLVPELLWWPWPIGWDTVEYIAHLLDFAQRPNPFEPHYWMGVMRNIPPLLDVLLLPAALLGHAWTTFKLYPPIAYAALAAAAVLYAQRALGLGWRGGVLAGLATALYILNLRISWDYQRQLLGSVLMILSLAYLDSRRRWGAGEATVAAALLVLTALSHEVTALASIFLAAAYAHAAARRSDWAALTAGLAALAFSALLELWYWGPARLVVPSEYTAVLPPGLVPYNAVDSTREAVSYLVAGFGPTLPLALIAISALRPRYTAVALGTLLAAGLSPLVAPYTAVVTWYRFLIGVAPIVAPLAVAGLLRATCDGRVIAAYLLFLAVPGILFAYSFSQASMLATSLREFPPALIPAGVDRLKDWSQLAQYFAENPPAGPILVEDESTARWVHLAIRNPTPSTLVWAFPISQVCNLSSASGPLILVTRGKLNLTCGSLTLLYNGTYKVYRLDPVPSLH